MDKAALRFQQLLNDNNLTAQLTQPQVKYIQGGGVIISEPSLLVTFTDPNLEEVKDAKPVQPSGGQPSAKAVE
jgi:hypothetical protein